jgi:hypothetical protein
MSESKCKHILYRNEKIDVGGDGWVTIENERYLVINSLRECEEHFNLSLEQFPVSPSTTPETP